MKLPNWRTKQNEGEKHISNNLGEGKKAGGERDKTPKQTNKKDKKQQMVAINGLHTYQQYIYQVYINNKNKCK